MNRFKVVLLTSLIFLLVSISGVAAQNLIPIYDKGTSLWGYAMEKPDGEGSVNWIVEPQFAWAGSFNEGMASVIIGCRYADCKNEPGGRKLSRRAHVVISNDFKRTDFVVPEDDSEFENALFNDMSVYAIANDNYGHIGRFGSEILGHACVKLKKKPENLNCQDFFIDKKGHLKIMTNGELVSADIASL
ncbi:WG repeat-containing protein [uncultured Desulfuromusa sp.]|uniref:WG repeat-containing protein n=1 Tax=uncultured Desulfuromusa sp. TaxID=219183 RepID=UPI002AA8E9E3|nr:WG repeat-containing protein [uncultured Desulfuromusa sp.]